MYADPLELCLGEGLTITGCENGLFRYRRRAHHLLIRHSRSNRIAKRRGYCSKGDEGEDLEAVGHIIGRVYSMVLGVYHGRSVEILYNRWKPS